MFAPKTLLASIIGGSPRPVDVLSDSQLSKVINDLNYKALMLDCMFNQVCFLNANFPIGNNTRNSLLEKKSTFFCVFLFRLLFSF